MAAGISIHPAVDKGVRPGRKTSRAAGLIAMLPAASPAQQDQAPFNERPADASVTMDNSSRYPGSFQLSTTARVCGEVPAELNFAGVPAFIVQFYPENGQGPIRDISFDSKELVGGVAESSVFFLTVAVHSPKIGSPPAYVLDTSRPDMAGTAALTAPAPGTVRLEVRGVNDMNEAIELSLECRPRG
jgi:hypothetical protein